MEVTGNSPPAHWDSRVEKKGNNCRIFVFQLILKIFSAVSKWKLYKEPWLKLCLAHPKPLFANSRFSKNCTKNLAFEAASFWLTS